MALNDWLPLVTSIGGTAVGLGGVYATLRSGKRQQDTALEVARLQAARQAGLVEQERKHRKREAEYERLLAWAYELKNLFRSPKNPDASQKDWDEYRIRVEEEAAPQLDYDHVHKHSYKWSADVNTCVWAIYDATVTITQAVRDTLDDTSDGKVFPRAKGIDRAIDTLSLATMELERQVRAELIPDEPFQGIGMKITGISFGND